MIKKDKNIDTGITIEKKEIFLNNTV